MLKVRNIKHTWILKKRGFSKLIRPFEFAGELNFTHKKHPANSDGFLRSFLFFLFIICCNFIQAQNKFQSFFDECKVKGCTTIYDLQNQNWIYSDSVLATKETLPGSTFKIINLLIALETGVIKNENDLIKWPGSTSSLIILSHSRDQSFLD